MDPTLHTTIKTAATQVVQQLRAVPAAPPGLGWNHETLSGACGVASWLLFRALQALGVPVVFCMDRYQEHCFCRVGAVIVDPTARQFSQDLPDVLIGTLDDIGAQWPGHRVRWTIGEEAQDDQGVDALLAPWPCDQRPQYYQDKGLI